MYSTLLMCCMLMAFASHAQLRAVKGTVTDGSTGEPLPGVNIRIEGSGTGVTTDLDGNYTIQVDSDDVLVFSFVGFNAQSISVGARSVIDVALELNVQSLNEVVVVGYGTMKRSQLTGAVATVGAEEFENQPVTRMEQALQGRASGVTITQTSGSPGAGLDIRIRGVSSINNSNPLILVDGMPVDGIDFLNPGDIETVTVLKDAATAGIYGARGANGVILITTKGGKKNTAPQIDYQGYYGVQMLAKKLELLNAEQYATLLLEANGGPFTGQYTSLLNDPAALGEGTDWQDAIFDPAPIQSHQVSVRGGNDGMVYSLVTNYFSQNGIVGVEKSKFERYTGRINTALDLGNRAKIGVNLNLIHFTRNGIPENDEFSSPVARALNMDPVTPVFKEDGTFNWSPYAETDLRNPANQIALTNSTWSNYRSLGQLYLEVEPIDGLKLKTAANGDVSFAEEFNFSPRYDLDPTDYNTSDENNINSVGKARHRWIRTQWENTATYDKTFGQSKMTSMLGTTWQQMTYTGLGGGMQDLVSNDPDFAYIQTFSGDESRYVWESLTEEALFSIFGRVNYSYAEKYLFSALLRRDGSSKFGSNNRFGYFPSFSAGWLLSEEQFIKNILPQASYLKLRTSYGANGSDQITPYLYIAQVSQGQNYVFGDGETITQGIAPTVASNPDLRWEANRQFAVGLESGWFDDKLSVNLDYFNRLTDGMLAFVSNPAHVGVSNVWQNIGNVRNWGLEMSTNYRHMVNNFSYDLGLNATYVQNKVLSLGEEGFRLPSGYNQGAGGNISMTEVGMPIGYFYGYETDGLFQNDFEIEEHATQAGAGVGDVRYVDQNDDGVINDEDRVMIGNPTPDLVMGFTANLNYGNWDVSLLLQGAFGHQVYNATTRWDFNYVNRPISRLDRWTEEGSSTTEPRAVFTNQNGSNNVLISDRFVEDADFLRVKNMQVGYTIPKGSLSRMGVSSLRVYVSASNLYTFTGYSGYDPEIGTRGSLDIGIDRGFYPAPRIVMAGLNLKF